MFEEICSYSRKCDPETLSYVIKLAVEIARQSRKERFGTIFVVGDETRVLKKSKNLILDPLAGHPLENKDIRDPDMQETIKELSKLDGALIISNDGYVLSAARYIDSSSLNINLPMGLGSRHMAAASISKETDAMAAVVSENGIVRVFSDAILVSEIYPTQLERIPILIRGEYIKKVEKDVTIILKK